MEVMLQHHRQHASPFKQSDRFVEFLMLLILLVDCLFSLIMMPVVTFYCHWKLCHFDDTWRGGQSHNTVFSMSQVDLNWDPSAY